LVKGKINPIKIMAPIDGKKEFKLGCSKAVVNFEPEMRELQLQISFFSTKTAFGNVSHFHHSS
jgi:hypothetical protein